MVRRAAARRVCEAWGRPFCDLWLALGELLRQLRAEVPQLGDGTNVTAIALDEMWVAMWNAASRDSFVLNTPGVARIVSRLGEPVDWLVTPFAVVNETSLRPASEEEAEDLLRVVRTFAENRKHSGQVGR